MRLRLRFSPSALAPWRAFSLLIRSLRFSSFVFFLGRVDWLSADKSILPTTLGPCIRGALEMVSGSACGAVAGASSFFCSATGVSATGCGFSAFGSAGAFSSFLGSTAAGSGLASSFGSSAGADFCSFAFFSSIFPSSALGASGAAGLGATGLPLASSSILPNTFGFCIATSTVLLSSASRRFFSAA